jgi:hypothetical protein
MLLHQQAPTPDECQQPEDFCKTCRFFSRCREILLKKIGSMNLKEVETQAKKNSLGSLQWDNYTPDK